MNRSKGFTLIELLIVMSIGSSLLMLAVGIVHRSMSIHTAAREVEQGQQTAFRLATDFRRDVRLAVSAEGADNGVELSSKSNDGEFSTSYRVEEQVVTRVQQRPDGRRWRETYAFGPGSVVEISDSNDASRLLLTVYAAAGPELGPERLVMAVEASVGGRRRLVFGMFAENQE